MCRLFGQGTCQLLGKTVRAMTVPLALRDGAGQRFAPAAVAVGVPLLLGQGAGQSLSKTGFIVDVCRDSLLLADQFLQEA